MTVGSASVGPIVFAYPQALAQPGAMQNIPKACPSVGHRVEHSALRARHKSKRFNFPAARKGGGDFFSTKDFTVTTDQTISIDGVDYAIDSLSENAKAQLISLQAVDRRIATAQEELAILQTARIAYSNVVKQELEAK